MPSILCHPVKGRDHRVHETVVSSAVEHVVNVTAMHAKATASNRLARINGASRGPRVCIKGKSKERNGKSKKTSQNVSKVRARVKPRKLGLSRLEHPKSEGKLRDSGLCTDVIPLTCLARTILSLVMAGVTMNGMMTEIRLDGMKVGINSASSFLLGSFFGTRCIAMARCRSPTVTRKRKKQTAAPKESRSDRERSPASPLAHRASCAPSSERRRTRIPGRCSLLACGELKSRQQEVSVLAPLTS